MNHETCVEAERRVLALCGLPENKIRSRDVQMWVNCHIRMFKVRFDEPKTGDLPKLVLFMVMEGVELYFSTSCSVCQNISTASSLTLLAWVTVPDFPLLLTVQNKLKSIFFNFWKHGVYQLEILQIFSLLDILLEVISQDYMRHFILST